jgi:hypothetical protein
MWRRMNVWPMLVSAVMIGAGFVWPGNAAADDAAIRSIACTTIVDSLYQGILRRPPTAAEINPQRDLCLAQLATAATTPVTFYSELVAKLRATTPEAIPAGSDPEVQRQVIGIHLQRAANVLASNVCVQKVRSLYLDVLGREPDRYGQMGWISSCQNGESMASLRERMMQSTEYLGKQRMASASSTDLNRCNKMVDGLFQQVLERPAGGSLPEWTQHCLGGMDELTMRTRLLESEEHGQLMARKRGSGPLPMIPATINQPVPTWASSSSKVVPAPASPTPVSSPSPFQSSSLSPSQAPSQSPFAVAQPPALTSDPQPGLFQQIVNALTPDSLAHKDAPADPCAVQIRNLYLEVLGREPDAGGQVGWIGECKKGVSIDQLRHNMQQSEEYLMRMKTLDAANPSLDRCQVMVKSMYRSELQREGDPGGMDYWVGHCRQGMDESTMRGHFQRSEEYLQLHKS